MYEELRFLSRVVNKVSRVFRISEDSSKALCLYSLKDSNVQQAVFEQVSFLICSGVAHSIIEDE